MSMYRIQHLYQRVGFGLSPNEWAERKNWSVSQGIDELVKQAESKGSLQPGSASAQANTEMGDGETRQERRQAERRLVFKLGVDWIMRMGNPQESALLERISLFWHGHFACETRLSGLAISQLQLYRDYGLGHFRDLLLAVSQDPAMIRYLNNQQNRKDSPNENYARELMELFTIGRGNYTEHDVKEAARAFTGWSSNFSGQYVFRRFQHDFGHKTFMGRSGKFDGTDIIDILLERKETAYFLTRKIYRYFVNEHVDELRVKQLAEYFYRSDYHIGKLLKKIFSSEWFYAAANRGQRIKSPVELIAGLIRHLHIKELESRVVFGLQKALGQQLFKPPNVAGWPGGKQWIDNATLMLRLNLAAAIFKGIELDVNIRPELEQSQGRNLRGMQAEIDLSPISALLDGVPERNIYEQLSSYLLCLPVPPPSSDLINSRLSREQIITRSCLQIMSLPEYQMC